MNIKSAIYKIFLTGLLLPLLWNCKKEPTKVLPTITLATVTNITTTTASCSGEITSDGGAPVTA
ncbi:MAG: hypothetical protein NTY07_06040 [Bacteroidia bacterium]|nr:hypothetical protein [Bacteroidia bacterium]